ncbi:molybdenum cofactor biosynthesis protein MoaE [Neisseria sp. ZJ106]|uniref:Molybdopterin synthase catalytic subunit n=1 Tax=Neisseria lisongii TaxID=2912188 RepID=A0ABY7RLG3_9NEIS|nr:molybdenum cofactor biosynthesis protein MoaE [Neisseria lisongii]MCF7521292.1 molybdenum cofactor biosynthesis protein MoaE [Neisseria lisongii]WCL72097.1 molybdenum cofactor biosynthesis protein MoaE [Neisseria lisongii]
MHTEIRIQHEDFDMAQEYRRLLAHTENTGAVVSFCGLVRDRDSDVRLESLFLEHYPEVTENEIARIVSQAAERWPISACTVIHRVGTLSADEQIVLVLAASAHRKAAFAAAEYIMDYLKTEAPFWKKERFSDGLERWVEAKAADQTAAEQWKQP